MWGLTGVLREQSAALAVDDLLDERHVGGYGRGRDQADARHQGVYGTDESQPGVEPLDAQRVCRTQTHRSEQCEDRRDRHDLNWTLSLYTHYLIQIIHHI